jgi:transcriptional regulator with XRE-family HTH domain
VTVAAEANPTVARRQLAVYLKKLREQRRHTLTDVAKYLNVAVSQASRLDTGARGYSLDDVRSLATWYGLGSAEEASLLALAEESRKRGWWQQVDLPDSYRTLIGMEQAALSVNEYTSSVIPGLLQTREYAHAMIRASELDIRPERVEQAVAVRMRRQQILGRDRAPQLWVVVDEAALARVTGGLSVMRAQLEYLHEAATRPGITVQVIGFEYGAHPGGESHVILLTMPGELPDVLYSDSLARPDDSSDERRLHQAHRLWEVLKAIALDPRSSSERIANYIQRLA